MAHLFERFYRADSTRTNSSDHHGFGLPIVKAVVRLGAHTRSLLIHFSAHAVRQRTGGGAFQRRALAAYKANAAPIIAAVRSDGRGIHFMAPMTIAGGVLRDEGTDVDVMRNTLNFAVDATSGDLSAFKGRGGKMIMFQGLTDPVAAPEETVNYLKAVEKAMPGQSDQFVKLFNAPGMAHCRGGTGPNYFGNWAGTAPVPFPQKPADPTEDLLAAMEQWVEKGRVPNEIIATRYAGNQPTGAVERTMPLCAWPKVSKYKGTGDVNSAASFSCVDPD